MTVVFGLGTRLRVRMRTKLENGILSKRTAATVLWIDFIDQGEFEAMKMLSGYAAPRCDKHQFHAKMTVSI